MDEINDIFKRLKLIREEKNISLEEISKSTRIRISYLEAIENGEFDIIPSVYDKLFFQSYLEAIKVDKIDHYLETFHELRRELRGKDSSTITSVKPITPGHDAIQKKRTLFIGLPLLLAAIIIITFALYSKKIESTSADSVKEVPVQEIVDQMDAREKMLQDSLAKAVKSLNQEGLVNVSFKAIEQTWLRYIKDRSDTTELLLRINDNVAVEADSLLEFLIGKANGLNFTINGENTGVLGDSGEIILNLAITKDGIINKRIKKETD